MGRYLSFIFSNERDVVDEESFWDKEMNRVTVAEFVKVNLIVAAGSAFVYMIVGSLGQSFSRKH